MTRRREVLGRLKTLREIGSIMNSLKNISLMETRKIGRFLSSQQQVVGNIEAAAQDFLHFHPEFRAPPAAAVNIWLLIGSERGFCGDFNQSLLAEFARAVPAEERGRAHIIAVGRKLAGEIAAQYPQATICEGPGVADEVAGVLAQVVSVLNGLPEMQGHAAVSMLYHDDDRTGVRRASLLPPFADEPRSKPRYSFPPGLTLAPEAFFQELVRHYLFAALHAAFFTSLMAEHQQRVRHLDGATRRFAEQEEDLLQKSNVLRQEEITEEIEEVMLGATGV